MTAAEIIAIIQLAMALEPAALQLVNKLVEAFSASDKTPEERMKMIEDLAATLKPMAAKE